jgi:FkbM family methyltransferase
MKSIIRVFTLLYPLDKGVWRISRHLGPYVKGEALVTTKRGIKLLLRLENYIDRIIFLFGKYEEDLVNTLLDGIRKHKCDAFLDIGGNLGYYSLSVHHMKLVDEIHCFEPDPLNLQMLRTNVLLNHAEDVVTVHSLAASSERKELRFGLQRSTGHLNTGLSKILADGENPDGTEITVQGVPVDEIIAWKHRRLAIKIDVEGAEEEALRGMLGVLQNNSCFLQIEVWPTNAETISKALVSSGYRLLEKRGEQDYYWSNFRNER